MARVRIPEKTMMIISIAVAVVVVAGLFGLCYSRNKKIEEIRKQIEGLEKQAADLQKKIDRLPDMEAERDKLAVEIAEYEKMLPDAKEVENLMTMLSQQAHRSDCFVGDFTLVEDRGMMAMMRGGGAGGAAYKKIKFECSVSSRKPRKGYFSACKFLNLLERYKRFIAADEFEIKAGKTGGASMTMDLSAHTYMFTGQKAPPKGAAGGRGGARR